MIFCWFIDVYILKKDVLYFKTENNKINKTKLKHKIHINWKMYQKDNLWVMSSLSNVNTF